MSGACMSLRDMQESFESQKEKAYVASSFCVCQMKSLLSFQYIVSGKLALIDCAQAVRQHKACFDMFEISLFSGRRSNQFNQVLCLQVVNAAAFILPVFFADVFSFIGISAVCIDCQ